MHPTVARAYDVLARLDGCEAELAERRAARDPDAVDPLDAWSQNMPPAAPVLRREMPMPGDPLMRQGEPRETVSAEIFSPAQHKTLAVVIGKLLGDIRKLREEVASLRADVTVKGAAARAARAARAAEKQQDKADAGS